MPSAKAVLSGIPPQALRGAPGPEARSQQSRATTDAPPPNLANACAELAIAVGQDGRESARGYRDCAMVLKGHVLMPLSK